MNSSFFEKISFFCVEVFDFIILNIFWLIGTLLGGIFFGYAPSTIALFTVLRQKIMADEKAGTATIFWRTYKKEFIRGNFLGIFLTLIFFISYINQSNFQVYEESIFIILTTLSKIARWIFLLAILYIFPMYVHYETNLANYFSKSLTLTFLRPHITFFLAVWCWLMYSIFLAIPGLIPFFAISISAFGIMIINYHFFMKNEANLSPDSEDI